DQLDLQLNTPVIVVLSAFTICPPGWISFGGNCYWVVSNKMFLTSCWPAAREDCISRGADLVSIHNMEEESFLSTYTKGKSKWIGLKHNPTDGGYHWSDATPVSHTNWGNGEPNNHEGQCAQIRYCFIITKRINGLSGKKILYDPYITDSMFFSLLS
uniref:C-type lectin domain-containing protein n=1 Tax=Oncorhynchus kisutch TaxID=8019 RepID=A0A8C7HYZ2_ONCKI